MGALFDIFCRNEHERAWRLKALLRQRRAVSKGARPLSNPSSSIVVPSAEAATGEVGKSLSSCLPRDSALRGLVRGTIS